MFQCSCLHNSFDDTRRTMWIQAGRRDKISAVRLRLRIWARTRGVSLMHYFPEMFTRTCLHEDDIVTKQVVPAACFSSRGALNMDHVLKVGHYGSERLFIPMSRHFNTPSSLKHAASIIHAALGIRKVNMWQTSLIYSRQLFLFPNNK